MPIRLSKKIKRITLWTISTVLLCLIVLIGAILNPQLLYAESSQVGELRVLSDDPLDEETRVIIQNAYDVARQSPLYESGYPLDICIGENSLYIPFFKKISGPAFGVSTLNKVIMYARQDYSNNTAHWRDRTWQLSEVLSHEMVHCFQYHRFGYRFPIKTPTWIVEGYAEYIARQAKGVEDLSTYFGIYLQSVEDGKEDWEWIPFGERNGSPLSYLRYRLLVQYLLEVESISYEDIIQNQEGEGAVFDRMQNWYTSNQAKAPK